MSTSVAARRGRGDQGFTLVELLVVVLVLAILMAIAIPTFLGARDRGQDRAAQSTARNTLTAAKILYGDASPASYALADDNNGAALRAIEPQYAYVVGATVSANDEQPSVSVSTNGLTIGIAVRSDSGTCFLIKDVQDSTNVNSIGTFYAKATSGLCTGARALTISNASTSW